MQHTDYIIVLEAGKIIEEGTNQSLIKKRGFYYEINIYLILISKNSVGLLK